MTVDGQEAIWLRDLIIDCHLQLASHPGMTIEIENRPNSWLQLIFNPDDDFQLDSVVVHFHSEGEIVTSITFVQEFISLPPGTSLLESMADNIVTLSIRNDIPPMALSLFVLQIFSVFLHRSDDEDLLVQIEGGY